MSITSPLTSTNNISFERAIPVTKIVGLYNQQCKIDVSRFFEGQNEVSIYKCNKTGYRFYYPFNLSGDGKFYEQLQALPGYYPEWKWEHSIVRGFIKKTDRVLEIGCAEGSFLKELQKDGVAAVGLELNEAVVEIGKQSGVSILNETIQDHAIHNKEHYEVVCSFQVMEHIADIKEVIQASVDTLKAGGSLFIGVPNNDSFIDFDEEHTLNLPPHHMGLWNKTSLQNLETIFPIKFDRVFYEDPLPHHRDLYLRILRLLIEQYKEKQIVEYGILGRILNKLLSPVIPYLIKQQHPTLGNFTIVARFTKL